MKICVDYLLEKLDLLAPWNENVKDEIKRRASGGN